MFLSSRFRLTGLPCSPQSAAGSDPVRPNQRGPPKRIQRIPPFWRRFPPETVRRIVARIRAESGPSPASFRARVRINSRSALRPRTSNRALPLRETLPEALKRPFLRRRAHWSGSTRVSSVLDQMSFAAQASRNACSIIIKHAQLMKAPSIEASKRQPLST